MYLEGVEGAWRSVRYGDWKLIVIPHPEQDIVELYNLREDPLEKQNIAAQLPERVDELKAVLKQIETRVPSEELQFPTQTELSGEDLEMLESIGYLAQ